MDQTPAAQQARFHCLCGKRYLSYPAAYTHIKNKHNRNQSFLKNIKKTSLSVLKKGRPKKPLPQNQSLEYKILTLVECAIIKIYQELISTFNNILLQGNQELSQQEFKNYYQSICYENRQIVKAYNLSSSEKVDQFIELFTKHFTAKTASRIKLTVILIFNAQKQGKLQLIATVLQKLNLWGNVVTVNKIILKQVALPLFETDNIQQILIE